MNFDYFFCFFISFFFFPIISYSPFFPLFPASKVFYFVSLFVHFSISSFRNWCTNLLIIKLFFMIIRKSELLVIRKYHNNNSNWFQYNKMSLSFWGKFRKRNFIDYYRYFFWIDTFISFYELNRSKLFQSNFMKLEIEMINYIRNFNQSVMMIKIGSKVEIKFTSNQNMYLKRLKV